ncbi:LysR family transcriptional regulator [Thalassobacter stenotrophicus]|jgi:DNA-binding transcriptional LysR family regulator|uniref:LysR family transcriptional regulator n=1 Tax=Thalassobacter stenotrophicus TaxID=266809 RepID=UPI0022A9A1F8|nr:LysR family transcriptional regulator [Thalassobacter stenotrophicus]UYP69181.1 LysR family transcriptional regulator [Thalassobacter stenotrophicus]
MANINNIRMFTRVYELENMSAAARDLRVSAAVASSRIGELEKQLGIRLFTRTTRSIQPTEQGRIFYPKALKVLEALEEAEAAVHEITLNPRGSIFVSAPLGIGRRLIAPNVAVFREKYPEIHTRLRLSDRALDVAGEGLDVAFVVGNPPDSGLMMKPIATFERVLCASPEYIRRKGRPVHGADLISQDHDCLLLRFPGSTEFRWSLNTSDGYQNFDVTGPFACDDGDVLTEWALDGRGIINKPTFEIQHHLDSGALIPVCQKSPPPNTQLAVLYPHRKNQDPKSRFFIDFMSDTLKAALA